MTFRKRFNLNRRLRLDYTQTRQVYLGIQSIEYSNCKQTLCEGRNNINITHTRTYRSLASWIKLYLPLWSVIHTSVSDLNKWNGERYLLHFFLKISKANIKLADVSNFCTFRFSSNSLIKFLIKFLGFLTIRWKSYLPPPSTYSMHYIKGDDVESTISTFCAHLHAKLLAFFLFKNLLETMLVWYLQVETNWFQRILCVL